MRVARYLLIAACAGLVIAGVLWWRSQPAAPSMPQPAVASAQQPAPVRLPSATPPATGAHRKAAQTLAALVTLPSEFEQSARLYQLALDSNPAALNALLDEAQLLADPDNRLGATQILLLRLIELQPEAALARVAELDEFARRSMQATLYRAWLHTDSAAAIAHLQAQPLGVRRQVVATLAAMNRMDPNSRYTTALTALMSEQDGGEAAAASARLNRARTDPTAAWRDALAETNLRKRNQALQQIIYVWAESDPQAALAATSSLAPNLQRRLQMAAVGRWLQKDPEAALGWIRQQPPSLVTTQLYEVGISQLSRLDIDKAMALAGTLPDAQRRSVIDRTLSRLARDDPQRALNELRAANIDLSGSQTYAAILSQAKLFSFEESLARSAQLTSTQRRSVQGQLFRRWASEDPDTAARYLDDIDDETLRSRAGSRLVRQWAELEPEAAASWIATQPEPQRDGLRAELVTAASNIDPVATTGYLAEIQSAELHDQAAMSLLAQLTFDLPAADRLLQRMRTDQGRAQAEALLHRVLSRLGAPEAARYRSGAEPGSSIRIEADNPG